MNRIVAGLLFLLVGCGGHFPRPPAAGGPAWRELSTPHFRLTTDLSADDARQILSQLERLRSALLVGFGASAEIDSGHVPVIVLQQGWSDFAVPRLGGFFTQALFQPLVVLRAGASLENEEMIKHELVHFLSRKVLPDQPTWFFEGLAGYLQTVECPQSADHITIGQPPIGLMHLAQRGGLYPIADMMAARAVPSENADRFYSTAWLTVHYLVNHYASAMRDFEKALNGKAPHTAWQQAFPTLTPAQLEWDLRTYVDSGQYALLSYPFGAPDAPVSQGRVLGDADVHAIRAMLLAIAGRSGSASFASERADELQAHAIGWPGCCWPKR